MVALWISVSKVAERLGIDKAEVRQQLRDRGLPTRVTESNRVEVLVAPPGTPNQDFHGALMAVRQEAERRRESAAAAAEAVEAASERILADLKRDRRIRRYILVGALAVALLGAWHVGRTMEGFGSRLEIRHAEEQRFRTLVAGLAEQHLRRSDEEARWQALSEEVARLQLRLDDLEAPDASARVPSDELPRSRAP